MIAPIPQNVDDADDPPVLQFVKTIADIGAGDAKRGSDLFRRQRTGGEKKQSMDLGDGAVDAPAGSHFAPMEDELLGDRGELFYVHSVISV